MKNSSIRTKYFSNDQIIFAAKWWVKVLKDHGSLNDDRVEGFLIDAIEAEAEKVAARFEEAAANASNPDVLSDLYLDGQYGRVVIHSDYSLTKFMAECMGKHQLKYEPQLPKAFMRLHPLHSFSFNSIPYSIDYDQAKTWNNPSIRFSYSEELVKQTNSANGIDQIAAKEKTTIDGIQFEVSKQEAIAYFNVLDKLQNDKRELFAMLYIACVTGENHLSEKDAAALRFRNLLTAENKPSLIVSTIMKLCTIDSGMYMFVFENRMFDDATKAKLSGSDYYAQSNVAASRENLIKLFREYLPQAPAATLELK